MRIISFSGDDAGIKAGREDPTTGSSELEFRGSSIRIRDSIQASITTSVNLNLTIQASLPLPFNKTLIFYARRGVSQLIKIYIARHGETPWNEQGRIQGRSDPELSSKGLDQSLALRDQLKDQAISAIYTSTLQRSIHTAEPLAEHLSLSIQRQPELDEIAFGMLEGMWFPHFDEESKAEWERFKNDRFVYRIPGAENYADVADRIRPLMNRILQEHQGQEVLIVGHRVVNRLLIGMLLEYPVEIVLKIDQPNDCIYLIKKNGEAKVFYCMDGIKKEGIFLVGQEKLAEQREAERE
jgi:broad specificity phosphatase PhoE